MLKAATIKTKRATAAIIFFKLFSPFEYAKSLMATYKPSQFRLMLAKKVNYSPLTGRA
jgi:hypothetical protein